MSSSEREESQTTLAVPFSETNRAGTVAIPYLLRKAWISSSSSLFSLLIQKIVRFELRATLDNLGSKS